jgi:transcription initiation factor TFIID TATA-box-binding protein
LPKSKIVNVVATASLNQAIDFDELRKHKEIFHDSNVYRGMVAYFKAKAIKGKISIFSSGKMISVGTTSEKQAIKELEIAQEFLDRNGLSKPVRLNPMIQNIVVTSDFEKNIDLEKLLEHSKAIYEPEQFPGAILRLEDPFKVSVLIFASGKVVIAGLKSSDQIKPITNRIMKLIAEF